METPIIFFKKPQLKKTARDTLSARDKVAEFSTNFYVRTKS